MQVERIQAALRGAGIDGWLFYDHHHRDPIAYRVLGLDPHSFVSRRWFCFVPAHGDPRKLVHRIEPEKLDAVPGPRREYSSWGELEAGLAAMLGGAGTVAMQYSPRNAIMYISLVDAGTVDLVRSLGKEVVSSANLVSQFEAVLTEAQIATHFAAQVRLDRVLGAAWARLREATGAGGTIDEFTVVQFMREGMAREGLWTDHGPNVSAGPNSADSHYEPSAARSRPVANGDFVLIDAWAKLAGDPQAVWYDITWTGVIGRAPTEREETVFAAVRDARDAAITRVQAAFADRQPIAGWEADDAARDVIRARGFAPSFTHRTGHNIAVELHGNGAHLDNLETHDDRLILPLTCFSVEPGVYFPGEFGVRSEVNMITRPGEAVVTGPRQRSPLRL